MIWSNKIELDKRNYSTLVCLSMPEYLRCFPNLLYSTKALLIENVSINNAVECLLLG